MIGAKLKELHFRQNVKYGLRKKWWRERKQKAIEHFNEITRYRHGEGHRIFELERTAEGDTRIRKVNCGARMFVLQESEIKDEDAN